MSYTAELREFFENLPINSDQSLPHRQVIENGRSKLFDFDYPVFDMAYKNVFETHFIRKFYMREIGFETFGLFKFQLETWLLINMPYYNKLFESELLQYDPLTNTKVDANHTKTNQKTHDEKRDITDTKTIDGENNASSSRKGTTENNLVSNRTGLTEAEQLSTMAGNTEGVHKKDETGNVTDDNFKRELESNNPDSRLTITTNDGEGVIEYASYIKEDSENKEKTSTVNGTNTSSENTKLDSSNKGTTNVTDNQTDNATQSVDESFNDSSKSNITQDQTKIDRFNSTIVDTEDYIQHRIGKIGVQSFPKMIQEYRNSLLRIESQIFNEMNELFMLVY